MDLKLRLPVFGSYAFRAALFALALTAVCLLIDPIWKWLMAYEAVSFMPKWLALALGSVHSPSFMGLFAGLFLEWFLLGLLASLVFWMLKSTRQGESAT
jgi:hypothetical protein